MGVQVIKVPDVGEGVAEVELVSWSVTVGDEVSRNQILAEVMTDKANVEIPAPIDGVVAALNGEIGGVMAVGSTLIELTVEGAGDEPEGGGAAIVKEAAQPRSAPLLDDGHLTLSVVANGSAETATTSAGRERNDATTDTAAALGRSIAVGERPPRPEGEKPLATPALRHRARVAGIDLRRVPGTGPAGRITHEDLDAFWHGAGVGYDGGGAAGSPVAGGRRRQPDQRVDEQPIIGIRRQIAKRTLAATQSIPHITYVEEVDVTALEDLRATLNDDSPDGVARLTVLPFLIRAIVDAVGEFPRMNAHVDDDAGTLTTHGGVHVGIATQTPNGLVVPVVRHAETASIWELAQRVADLAEAARSGKVAPADLTGSTITITSLGPLGGLVTTPVINKPEVAIVGVNKITTRPVYIGDALLPRKMMNLSSSFDHRIVDGWDAASFVQRIRRSIEQPALLFVDDPASGSA